MGFPKSIIIRDGTSQRQRLAKALDSTFIKIEERQVEDLLEIIKQFAGEIAYYNGQNKLDGDWTDFFSSPTIIQSLTDPFEEPGNQDAHLTLLVTFLQLLEIAKKDMNQLNIRHLEFYYKDVLRFNEKNLVPDNVHIIFGLTKNTKEAYLLKKENVLNAGKDENGDKLFYQTDRDIVINKAQILSLKTIYVDYNNDQRLYAAPQANSGDGIGGAFNSEEPGWSTFGENQLGKQDEERNMIDGELGFAIASPLLLLNEGSRTITLEMVFQSFRLSDANFQFLEDFYGFSQVILDKLRPIQQESFKDQQEFEAAVLSILEDDYDIYIDDLIHEALNPFRGFSTNHFNDSFLGYVTTIDSWFRLDPIAITVTGQNQLTLIFEMDVDDPPLVFFEGTEEINGLPTTYPALKLVCNPDVETYPYKQHRDLQISSYSLEVEVDGLRNLVLQNEDGPLDPGQAFLPFGARPSINANFYIGSHEIFQKRLDNLSFTLSWANLPTESTGFESYYEGYGGAFINTNRQADVDYLQKGIWSSPPSNNSIDLFNTDSNGTFIQSSFTIQIPLLTTFERNPEMVEFDALSPGSTSGFVRLSLQAPDFGHHVFQNLYAAQALAIVNGNSDPLPNTPYSPKLKSIELNYTARETVTFGTENDGFEQFFHIQPFGSIAKNTGAITYCFPQFSEGTLLIGIEALQLPQNLSVLFQVLEGSADPDVSIDRNDVQWTYLKNDEWVELTDNEIQVDTTLGLQTSGIIDFSIPPDASEQHSLLPSGLHWLRAEIQKDPTGISKTIGIHAQAMSATFIDSENRVQQFLKPLEAETISKLVSGVSSIKSVEQPYASFGGRPTEQEPDFLNRISERLRHKQRAIGVWDYERLILEGFPFIYKVKCLNHSDDLSEASPGNVTLIVIPDLQNKNAADPLQPKTSVVLRESIKDYLSQYVSLFVSLEVENPKYEPILVDLKVGLKSGYDGSFYGELLNEDLKRFLSPWAFEIGEDISFGGRIYKSSILAFIEEQPYVDYITDFRLFHLNKSPGIGDMYIEFDFEVSANTIGEEVLAFAEASTARSILVSARNHTISVLQPGEYVCTGAEIPSGIGTMILEYDFIVS